MKRLEAALALLLAGCGADTPASGGADAAAYAGVVGRLYELHPPAGAADDTAAGDTAADTATAPPGPTRWLRIDATAWTLSEGDDIDTALVIGTFALRADDGLVVDGTRLLPGRLTEGASADGARVRAIAPWTTWYGTFPRAAEVAVDEGAWKGTQVFAENVGPVHLTLDGASWEVTWYE